MSPRLYRRRSGVGHVSSGRVLAQSQDTSRRARRGRIQACLGRESMVLAGPVLAL